MILARWVLYLGTLGVTGAFGATLLSYPAHPRVMAIGRRTPLLVLLGCFLLITAQLENWFGEDGFTDPENLKTMLTVTLWGRHWSWLAGVAGVASIALPVAVRRPAWWIYIAGASTMGLVITVPQMGHGGTHDDWMLLAHRAHLFGAGLWIGSLAIAFASGLRDTDALLLRLRRFAPFALTGAGLVAVSGGFLAWRHIDPFSRILTSLYGRILLAKMAAALVAGGLGFLNWRSPRLKLIVAEVAVALIVVLALTAWLSEVEMPMRH